MVAASLYRYLLLGILLSLTLHCHGIPLQADDFTADRDDTERAQQKFETLLQIIRAQINRIKAMNEGSKRACQGFSCAHTHIASQAGRGVLTQHRMQLLSQCLKDPSCTPGKRRRRSTSKLLSLLTRTRTIA